MLVPKVSILERVYCTCFDKSGGVHNNVIKKHTWSVVFGHFGDQGNAFGNESLWQKYFTGNIEAIWTRSLQLLRSKLEDKDLSVCLTLRTSLLLLLVMCLQVSVGLFTIKTLLFRLISIFELMIHQGKPQYTWPFSH